MPFDILMPALSPTMEKGNLSRWLKKEGDKIKSGDVLAEIETDKATMEVEAVDEGVLAKILVPEGTADVPVNDVIGVIAGEGEDANSVASRPLPAGEKAKEPLPAMPAALPVTHSTLDDRPRIFASPLARRIAKDAGLDLAAIKGSGPHGRIVEQDIKSALAREPAAGRQLARPPTAPVPARADTIRQNFVPGTFEEIPHDTMRQTIARRLVEAARTIPHFYLAADCNLDALLALREAINAAAPRNREGAPAYKISVNDCLIKALAHALIRVPGANVTWTETAVLKHHQADVGVAVAIPGGLITPIIRAAEAKSLSIISNEMKDLAARARDRKLLPEEYQGGSTTVSNLGMYGIRSFSAIINPPQATILAVGAAKKRAIVKDGEISVATIMGVTLSCDHRAVDGVLGAELLAAFKSLIENPAGMLA
jgi:pyruvate dehydrogenase E2 component (dihydrolipoamide acetyltransferase)